MILKKKKQKNYNSAMETNERPKINGYIFFLLFLLGVLPAILYCADILYKQEEWDKEKEEQLFHTVTSQHRGTNAERDLVRELLKNDIPAQTIFHDLYIELGNDKFSQVDLVVATKVGIIVFEVKDYSGWIYGNGNQTNWTKVLAFGEEKYPFYNPIKQNEKHIANLKKLLSSEQIPFYSIIVFYGNCELKDIDFVPRGTYIVRDYRVLEVFRHIINNNPQANYNDKRKIVELLKKAVANGDKHENIARHCENINDMLGKDRVYR
ncbi:MAG: NERD domain-containing protein [Firmicutes bacterium]|nr:NERD domain-containing protein [Bacillota bacterium]